MCNHDDKNPTTEQCAHGSRLHSRVDEHVRCVEGALGLGGHVVIGVGRVVVHRHHADAVPSVQSFLLDFVVHLCTCGQTVFCDRQFHL